MASKFRPPDITSPPTIVVVEWIDACQGSTDETNAAEAGGLMLLPSVGYHIRNGKDPKCGPFIVLAREHSEAQGTTIVRDTHTIPAGWIRKWSTVTTLSQLFPKEVL